MALTKKIIKIISNYLSLKETAYDRKELYKWYDDLQIEKRVSPDELKQSYLKSKHKLFDQIRPASKVSRQKKIFWQFAAVAAVLTAVIFVYILVNYSNNRNKYQPLQLSEINSIMPRPQKAIIIFSNGQQINPDTIKPNEKIVLNKDLVLSKSESGNIIFTKIGKGGRTNVTCTLQTFQATKYTLKLSDGTKVYLNANSKLTFPGTFTKADRIVNLDGEGYFEVTKTLRHTKFFVRTNDQIVKVLGTKFNIRSYNNKQVQTTLIEGSVSITPTNKFFDPVTIKPNQQAVLKSNGLQISKVQASKALGWKEGFFVFNGNNTSDILSEIAKWYGLELDNSNIQQIVEHTGKIPSNVNLGQMIELLNYSGINVKVYKNETGKLKLMIL